MKKPTKHRRQFLKTATITLFGIAGVEDSLGQVPSAERRNVGTVNARYPAIDNELAYSVVNAAHFDLEKVKALVTHLPELAAGYLHLCHVGDDKLCTGNCGDDPGVSNAIAVRMESRSGSMLKIDWQTKTFAGPDKANVMKMIEYLERLGDANEGALSLALSPQDKTMFAGDYKYGEGETETFNVGPYSLDPANFSGLPERACRPVIA